MADVLSARETAYRALRSRILNLDLKPNDSLNDKELAQQMGMSRTPIHEAIITLGLAKLVIVRPQSGTYVAPIDTELVDMEQFSRFTLEKEMILRTIPRLTEEAIRRYQENLQVYQFYLNALDPNRKARLFELDNAFHRIAFELNGMEHHFDWMQGLRHHIERIRVLSFAMNLDSAIIDEHRALVEAMSAGDAAAAVRTLEAHLGLYQTHLQNAGGLPSLFCAQTAGHSFTRHLSRRNDGFCGLFHVNCIQEFHLYPYVGGAVGIVHKNRRNFFQGLSVENNIFIKILIVQGRCAHTKKRRSQK